MNLIASGAFECSDAKAGRPWRDPCPQRFRFALRTWWLVKHAHDAVPYIRREHDALSHRLDARDGPVMGIAFHACTPAYWSKQITSRKSLTERQSSNPVHTRPIWTSANGGFRAVTPGPAREILLPLGGRAQISYPREKATPL